MHNRIYAFETLGIDLPGRRTPEQSAGTWVGSTANQSQDFVASDLQTIRENGPDQAVTSADGDFHVLRIPLTLYRERTWPDILPRSPLVESSFPMATEASSTSSVSQKPWIYKAGWDLRWLIGSSLIVPVVLFFVWMGSSSTLINLGITALIGGPHLFATFTATWFDPRFRRSHLWLLVPITLLIPLLVVFLALNHFQVLLSLFIFSASLHVLHQNIYITDIYRTKQGTERGWWPRLIDYGVMLLCIYPIASYKLVHGQFMLGSIEILLPPIMKQAATYWMVWIGFSFFLSAWLVKTWGEWKRGELNIPKTVLISSTILVCFWVPIAASGTRLELAFQSVNAWHSIQYLGIVWYIQAVRREEGLIENPLMKSLAGPGKARIFSFYGFCLLTTAALLGVALLVPRWNPLGLVGQDMAQQYYYMIVLSPLLVHYAIDGYFFTVANQGAPDPAKDPFSAPRSENLDSVKVEA